MMYGELKPRRCKRTEATSGLAPLEMANRIDWTSDKKKAIWTLRVSVCQKQITRKYEILDDRRSAEIQ